MRFAWRLSAIILWAIAGGVGFPVLVVLVWLLSPDSDFSVVGIIVIAICAALLVLSGFALLRFVTRR